jgi:hypothetical protein
VSSSSQFQLNSLSSHIEFELMPSFGIAHDGSRIVGNPYLTGLWKSCPSSVQSPGQAQRSLPGRAMARTGLRMMVG